MDYDASMRFPRNNWHIIAAACGVWLLSWFFMVTFGHDPTIGNEGYFVWTACKAALPLIATVWMYGLAVRTAAAHGRNKLIVHLTYITVLGILIPTMWVGMQGSLGPHDAPAGVIVDVNCIVALVFGAAIFWVFRGIEVVAKDLRKKQDTEQPVQKS